MGAAEPALTVGARQDTVAGQGGVMVDKDERERAREMSRQWARAWREGDWIRGEAMAMAREFDARLAAMVEGGLIGSRRIAGAESYPRIRVAIWGDGAKRQDASGVALPEEGAVWMAAFEVDYGAGAGAQVGAWASAPALWRGGMPLAQRIGALREARRFGSPERMEELWGRLRACLESLSDDLDWLLEFEGGGLGVKGFKPAMAKEAADKKAWEDWLASEGADLVELGQELAAKEAGEWASMEDRVKSELSRISKGPRKA